MEAGKDAEKGQIDPIGCYQLMYCYSLALNKQPQNLATGNE